jgi:3-deoxy-D-manno-octulosonic-acid transferase
METELWPNMIAALHRRKIPLVIANARLSERSAKGYGKLGGYASSAEQNHADCRANEEDGDRFMRWA